MLEQIDFDGINTDFREVSQRSDLIFEMVQPRGLTRTYFISPVSILRAWVLTQRVYGWPQDLLELWIFSGDLTSGEAVT